VFFEHPITLATCLIGIRSARCSRRISAQSSTLNTSLHPRFDSSQGLRGVNFQASPGGQFPRAVDKMNVLLTTKEAAALLGLRPNTLEV
jgi:hypothetical protein